MVKRSYVSFGSLPAMNFFFMSYNTLFSDNTP